MGFRREERIPLRLPTTVWGMQDDGTLFVEQARTLDISPLGARLAGIKHAVQPGMVVGLQHGTNSGRFKVVWTGEPGTEKEGQIGVSCIEVGQAVTKSVLYLGMADLGAERHRRTLETAGYKVVVAGLREGFALVQERTFEAILLEHPVVGADMCESIQYLRTCNPQSRILIVSSQPGLVSEKHLAGADALVHKGMLGRELLARVEELLGPATQLKWPITRFVHRYPVTAVVQVRIVRSGQASLIEGRSTDMSEEGVALVLPGKLLPGETVSLQFSLPTAAADLCVYGTVRHRDGDNYGIEFMDISPEQRDCIRSLCQVLPPLTSPRR